MRLLASRFVMIKTKNVFTKENIVLEQWFLTVGHMGPLVNFMGAHRKMLPLKGAQVQ